MNQPVRDQELFARLDELGINHETIEHEQVFTVDESKALRGELSGAHVKNLFLRDKKKNLFLATVLEETQVDLKDLRKRVGASGNLSFGNAELLREVLGVQPGAVTPLAVFNDGDNRITMILDQAILDHDRVHAHPLRNDRTTALSSQDLLVFLRAEGYEPLIIDFTAPLEAAAG